MQNKPLVSFIIPVYNIEPDMLRECIDSIMSLSLSRQEREIIVVDDGSPSTPLNSIADLADEVVYIRQCHQGVSAARNTGMRMATGRYIQFADGRGKFLRAPYEHCLDIARYHNPDIVLFKSTAKDSDIDTPFTYNGPTTGSSYMRGNNIRATACGYLFERNMLGELRFAGGTGSDDEEFTPQLFLRSERFYATDSDAFFIPKHRTVDTTVHDGSETSLADTERVLLHLSDLVVPEHDRAALNRCIAQLTMEYLCNIIRYTHDSTLLNETTQRLASHGLYPLPDRDYTKRYKYFRKMMGNPVTRRLLFVLIRK